MSLVLVKAAVRIHGLRRNEVDYVEASDVVDALLQKGLLEPATIDDAPAVESSASRTALLDEAADLKIVGRTKMNHDELAAAIALARTPPAGSWETGEPPGEV